MDELITYDKLTEITLDERQATEVRGGFESELNLLKSTYDLTKGTKTVKDGYSSGIVSLWNKYAAIVKLKVIEIIEKELPNEEIKI